MNSQTVYRFSNRSMKLSIACVALLLAGCEPYPEKEAFYKITVPPQKLRQIETLELNQAQNQPAAPKDSNQTPPPAELELTLERCRAFTLENNLDLKVQLINPAIAAQRVSEEEARFEAAFSAAGGLAKTDTPVASTLDISGSNVEYSYTNLGVDMPLRTGGTLSFDLADNRTKTDSLFSMFNPSYNSDFSASISQPLLRNAGVRTSTYAIRIAEYDRQITDTRTKLEVIRAVAAVDRVYWRLYAARRELELRKQEYDLAKAQLDQARRLVESGERSQIEIIRAEAGVAQRLEAIITAENNLRDQQRELKRVLNQQNLPMDGPTIMIPATQPDPVRYQLDRPHLIQVASQNRTELLELELQIAQDISTIDYMHNQTLPLVTLDYTYNVNGLGNTRDNSYDLLFDKRFEDHRMGLQLQVPLGNEAAKSRLLQAFYQRRQRITSREGRQLLIEVEVLNAADQLEANWQRILASRQSTILNGRLYEAEKRQFQLGLNTTTDVLRVQTDFANAQSAEILALADYQIALVDLAYATGTLLGAAKVQWQPIIPQPVGN
jgi:outer membrane protein TolC